MSGCTLKTAPSEDEKDLGERLMTTLEARQNALARNDFWVRGSSSAGNHRFTCLIKEDFTLDGVEIDVFLSKRKTSPTENIPTVWSQRKSMGPLLVTAIR